MAMPIKDATNSASPGPCPPASAPMAASCAASPRPAFSSVPAVAAAATAGNGITRSRGTGGTRMAGEKLAATGARTARTLPSRF